MTVQNKPRKKSVKKIVIPVIIVLLLAGGAVGYYFYRQTTTASAATTAPDYNTATVRVGTLEISADGSGTLTPGKTVNLSFPVSGKLAEVNVKMGDVIEQGQVLAKLADITSLQAAVDSANLTLKLAQQALDTLSGDAASSLATARQELADAQQAYYDAKNAVVTKNQTRCEEATIQAYYDTYLAAKHNYEEAVANGSESDYRYYTYTVKPLKTTMDSDYAAYTKCLGYTDYEIQTTHDDLTIAEGTLKTAQSKVDALVANNGIDPTAYAQDQLAVVQAQLALETAKTNLEGAVMTAPISGTVLSVGGETGDMVGTSTFISIIDLAHPLVNFSADESDLALVDVGKSAEVTFDALPDLVFKGTVISMSPSLNSTQGYNVLTGVIQLTLDDTNKDARLLDGLSASVTIISGKAENAVLVPVEALRDLGDGSYGVMVMGSDGKPRLTVVEVGLMDATYAEIKSGLKQGDVVTTGAVETN